MTRLIELFEILWIGRGIPTGVESGAVYNAAAVRTAQWLSYDWM